MKQLNVKPYLPLLVLIALIVAGAVVLRGLPARTSQTPGPSPSSSPTSSASTVSTSPEADSKASPKAGSGTGTEASSEEGKFCGGIANFQCSSGYTCVLDGSYPDAGGKCMKK